MKVRDMTYDDLLDAYQQACTLTTCAATDREREEAREQERVLGREMFRRAVEAAQSED